MKPNQLLLIFLLIHLQLSSCRNQNNPLTSNQAPNKNNYEKANSTNLLQKEIPPQIVLSSNDDPTPQLLKETPHFQVLGVGGKFQQEALDSLTAKMESSFEEIENFIEQKTTLKPITCYLYPSAEKKGLLLNNTNQNSIDFQKNATHIVFNEAYTNNFLQLENQLIIRNLLGEAKTQALETGLGIYFTKNWQRKGYEYWASKLHLSGNMPPLKDLLQNEDTEHKSRILVEVMSGTFVAFLVKHWGKETFLKKYETITFDFKVISSIESSWVQFLDELSNSYKAEITTNQLQKKARPLPYFKGFNFAHEGYNIYDGYISQEAKKSLTALKQIGANSIAIVPYSGIKNPNALQPRDMRLWQRAVMENDESVIHSAFQARKLGMVTVLKPQIWIHKSWPGEVDFNTEEEWQSFFERYERWVLHYALLAEIHDFEAFCIGVEFVKATLKHPEAWVSMIERIKRLYSGSVTYAANWGEEFENTGIWKAVDFIGINCYYPLSKKENPSSRELQEGFEMALKRIEIVAKKYNKKVVFTEIGFRSIETPWINPHHYDWNHEPAYYEKDQKRCYEAVMSTLESKKDWCNGILWWKWPSYLNHSKESKTEFAPNGKAAQHVIEEWFKK